MLKVQCDVGRVAAGGKEVLERARGTGDGQVLGSSQQPIQDWFLTRRDSVPEVVTDVRNQHAGF